MSRKFCLQVLLTKIGKVCLVMFNIDIWLMYMCFIRGASYNTFLIDVVFTLDYYVMMQLCYQQLIHCANSKINMKQII